MRVDEIRRQRYEIIIANQSLIVPLQRGKYDAQGVPIWASGVSYNHPGAFLALQTDGNVVIYDVNGTPLWATNTWRP